jgi:hypothetical protein
MPGHRSKNNSPIDERRLEQIIQTDLLKRRAKSKPFQQYYSKYKHITDSPTGGVIIEANEEKSPIP